MRKTAEKKAFVDENGWRSERGREGIQGKKIMKEGKKEKGIRERERETF